MNGTDDKQDPPTTETTSGSCRIEPGLPTVSPAPAKPVVGRPFQQGNPGGGRRKMDAESKAMLKRGAQLGVKVLMILMGDKNTAKETRRKVAEYLIDRQWGRPVAAVSNADGSPLLRPASDLPGDNPIARLLATVAARAAGAAPGAPDAATPSDTTGAVSTAPGPAGAATRGPPS